MDKFTQYFGIDISKDFFDVATDQGDHFQLENSKAGFKQLKKKLPKGSVCIMEVTGVYHYRLAVYIYESGIAVSVVNPIRIKRFMEMHLRRNKTDKADAEMICQYGMNQELSMWSPPEEYLQKSRMIMDHISSYIKSRTMFKNRLHATKTHAFSCSILTRKLEQTIRQLDKTISELEASLEELIKEHEQENLTLLKQIPGLGQKTAIMLLILTEGFTRFDNAKQFSNFVGLAPIHRQSGSSVRGRSRISKQGNPLMRNLLFMCSFNACKCNKACKDLYERIVAKGKSKKLALIAVANKLIKQVFGIMNNKLNYDPEYRSVHPMI
jgi:transposase